MLKSLAAHTHSSPNSEMAIITWIRTVSETYVYFLVGLPNWLLLAFLILFSPFSEKEESELAGWLGLLFEAGLVFI